MSQVTSKMGLFAWNSPLDQYDFNQLAADWNKIDFHDHSPGRGVPIPMGGIAPGAVGTVQLATGVPIIQTGSIVLWPMTLVPAGYLLCDGTQYSSIVYPSLYAVIGITYGGTVIAGTQYFDVPTISIGAPLYGQLGWVIKN